MGHGRLAVPGSGRGVCGLDDHVRGGLGRLAGGLWPRVQVRVGSQHDTGVAQCSATRWLGTSASRWAGMTGDGKGPTVAKAGSLERSPRTVGDLDDHGGERCPARCAHGAWCSNACSRDAVDRRRDQGRGETLRPIEQGTRWTTWTRRVCVDGDRLTHNPEVAGSNPAPATSFRRSRPFPSRERALRFGCCSKTCGTTGAWCSAKVRQDGTGCDNVDAVDAQACDLWVQRLEVPRVPLGLVLLPVDWQERSSAGTAVPMRCVFAPRH